VVFQSGSALIHRGLHRHAALPIEKGNRTNMVLWLFGNHGESHEQLSAKERWTANANAPKYGEEI